MSAMEPSVERPLAATIDDTAAWLASRENTGAWSHVLGAGSERGLVARAAAAPGR